MTAMKAPERPQQQQQQQPQKQQQQQQQQGGSGQATTLNDRYGKIGISAVAGAVAHKPEVRRAAASRFTAQDSD
ncbi:MAG: hypothetical protein B7Y77_03050 [Bradyrhizobium sp. 35-63-5]|nr:MAG: hypothetical protein B7Y77_03050 [Bradyrhizobium sp. 35-63-5]